MKVALKGLTVVVAVITALFLVVWGCATLFSWTKVPVGKVGLAYTGGIFEGQQFKGVKEGSSDKFFNGAFDDLYELPANQRSYIVSKNAKEGDSKGEDVITAPSKDGVPFEFQTTTYFQLNLDHQVLRQFFERVCTKYDHCDTETDGWDKMLAESIRQVQESTLQNEARKYTTEQLWNDEAALLKVQESIATTYQDRVNSLLGGPYFENIRFSIKKAEPPESVVDAFNKVKQSALLIQNKKNEVEQAKLQALAAKELQKAIKDNPNYVLLKAIESGQIDFWVLPEGSGDNLTLPTPKK